MITVIPRSDWARRLREFTARNACRRTTWERKGRVVDREVRGTPERDAPFLGAAYDPWERDIRVMLADASGVPYVRTNSITDATRLAITTDTRGREIELVIEHPGGTVVLQFAPRQFEGPRWANTSADAAGRQAVQ